MNFLVSLFMTMNAVGASSPQSTLEAKVTIEESYYPDITYKSERDGWSLFGCRVEKVRLTGKDPVTFEDRHVDLSFYQSRNNSKERAVIILPPTGGVNILDRGYANEICSSGMTAVVVSGWAHQNETSLDYKMHNYGALRALAATRHTVEFLFQKNYKSIGLLGTSIGAVTGSLALGFESRISSAVLIAGGAHFTDIIVTSDESGATKLRERRMKAFGYESLDEYAEAVKSHVWVEPKNFLSASDDRETLVISADQDTTVLSEYQYALADLLQADHMRKQGDHLEVIKSSFWQNRSDIAGFFQESL